MFKFLFLRNTKISIFGGISKFRFWANFSKFEQFWVVFWANFATLVMVHSMPKLWMKS
jgi:hypothetical protein